MTLDTGNTAGGTGDQMERDTRILRKQEHFFSSCEAHRLSRRSASASPFPLWCMPFPRNCTISTSLRGLILRRSPEGFCSPCLAGMCFSSLCDTLVPSPPSLAGERRQKPSNAQNRLGFRCECVATGHSKAGSVCSIRQKNCNDIEDDRCMNQRGKTVRLSLSTWSKIT